MNSQRYHNGSGLLISGLLFLLAVAPGNATPSTNVAAPLPVIKLGDVKLLAAMNSIAKLADINFLIAPEVTRVVDDPHTVRAHVSLNWTNLTALRALEGLLHHYECQLVELPGTSVHVAAFTNAAVYPAAPGWMLAGTNAVIPLIQMADVPLDVALSNLATQAGLKVQFDSNVWETPDRKLQMPLVTLRWKNLTARQAFVALTQIYRLRGTKDSAGVIKVVRAQKP